MTVNIKAFYEFMSTYLKPSISEGVTFSSLICLYNERQKRSGNPPAYSGLFNPLVELYVNCSGHAYELENRNRVRKLKGWTFTDSNMLKLASIIENGLSNEANQLEANRLSKEITAKLLEDKS